MFRDGCEVGIAGTGFKLATDQPDYYRHSFLPRPVTRRDIPGTPSDETLVPEIRDWTFTDFSGGEGNKVFNEQEPATYDNGLCNPRRPGELAGAPPVTISTPTAPATAPTKLFLTNAEGFAYAGYDQNIERSANGTTWTATGSGVAGAGWAITCGIGDEEFIYYGQFNAAAGGAGTGRRNIKRVSSTVASATWSADQDGTAPAPLLGGHQAMAMLKPLIYVWNPGGWIYYLDTTVAAPAPFNQIYHFGNEITTTGTYVALEATDNTVAAMLAKAGITQVHEITAGTTGSGRPLISPRSWNGFTGTCMTFSQGFLYFAGIYNNQAQLFRFAMDRSEPLRYLGGFRSNTVPSANLTPVSISAGPGNQVLIVMSTKEVFVYDSEFNAISELDVSSNTGTLHAVNTYQDKRMVLTSTGTTVKVASWGMDTEATTQTGTMITGAWDGGLPEERNKIYIGERVRFDPITGGTARIDMYYCADEAGAGQTFTQVGGTIVAGSTDTYGGTAAIGDMFLLAPSVSNTVTFGQIRRKAVVQNGAVIRAMNAMFYPAGKKEQWELLLDLRHQASPGDLAGLRADQARAYLTGELTAAESDGHASPDDRTGLIRTNQIIQFDDGTGHSGPNLFHSFLVIVEEFNDNMKGLPEGIAYLRMSKVTPS